MAEKNKIVLFFTTNLLQNQKLRQKVIGINLEFVLLKIKTI